MARATRSSTNLEKSDLPAPPRPASKKRKRLSNADNDVHPSPKLPRTDVQPDSQAISSAADSHLDHSDATTILDILEAADSQGLLDRVFPLPAHTPIQGSFSLRTLLKQPAQHSLWVLRAAVQNLFPLSLSHPRSCPSDTAVQQHRFCKIALSLVDQASRNVVRIPPTTTSFLDSDQDATPGSPSLDDELPDAAKTQPQPSTGPAHKKYALMQHLPSGDYWSSLNANIHNSTKQLKDLSLGNAELVAIFPTPSTSSSATSIPTLGSYHDSKITTSTSQLSEQRQVSVGSFLDYGTWASFAPSFDHNGEIVGRSELAELLYHREQRDMAREERKRQRSEGTGNIVELEEKIPEEDVLKSELAQPIDIDAQLEGPWLSNQAAALKNALSCLNLENAISELLERNRKALQRLEELQKARFSKLDGGTSSVEEDTEEWETAHTILDSLTVLASLRPQSTAENISSIIPSPSVLRKLQRTLVRRPTRGWYGTLPLTKPTALRDDATVKVKPGGVVTAVATTTATPTTTTPGPATPYSGYSYAYGQQAYRPSPATTSYTPYKPGQYYQTPYLATATQQLGQQNYYGQQGYTGGATGQQPYAAYSTWYTQYNAPAANTNSGAASGSSSGRGTPQPAGSAGAAVPSTYGSFFASAGTPPPGTMHSPAVANTVLANKPGTSGAATWSAYAVGQQQNPMATFSSHLRSTQGYQAQQTGYHGTYASQQAQTPATR
ncbi:hypothetical protein AX15_001101 [Amanita polypyramis BW_CC]|nr:hypothetical protein AX15_001101 [Amanita polypyramis BW_CC]